MLTCSCPVLDDACKKIKLSYAFPTTGTVSIPHPSKKRPLHPSTPFPLRIDSPCLVSTMNQEGPLLRPAETREPNETRRTRTESSVSVVRLLTTSPSTAQDVKHIVGDVIVKDTGLTIAFGPPLRLSAGAASVYEQVRMKKSTARSTPVAENVGHVLLFG